MSAVRDALNVAARKLTLTRAVRLFLAATALAALAWTLVVLVWGSSTTCFLVVAGCWAAAVGVGQVWTRRTVLDAARRVERSAGWQERLSTLVELESSVPVNPFVGRLRGEVERLLAASAPVDFIPWNVQRLTVLAVGAALAAVVVTVLVPQGVTGMLSASVASAGRARAETILEGAVGRLEEKALDAPGVNELRLELVALLNDVRRKRNTTELRERTAGVLRDLETDPEAELRTDAGGIAEELGRTDALRPVSDAVRRLAPKDLGEEVRTLSEKAPGMSAEERRRAADVLAAASDAGRLPGLTEPLRRASSALAAGDLDAFQQAMRDFADAVGDEVKRAALEGEAVEEVRGVMTRVAAVLAGGDDPGRTTRRRKADFFIDDGQPTEDGAGHGNLTVHGTPPDIKQVWETSHAADTSLPKLDEVIRSGRTALERGELAPDQREYVRRYFGVEDDNR